MPLPTRSEDIDYGYNLLGSLRKDLRMLQGFSTVVQELIQNAEDAKATSFWMDFTARALKVGNDQEFTDFNFEKIVEIGSGNKRHDPDSIGSFGVGFVSVYQLTDSPEIYSRHEGRILLPLERKAKKISPVDHEWPTTFVLPWATERTRLRKELEVEPVDLAALEEFISEAQATFLKSAVFLSHLKQLHLLHDGEVIESLQILREHPHELVLMTASGGRQTYRTYDVPVPSTLQQEAIRRSRRSTLQLALPLTTGEDGLLYAFLPTRDFTHIPLHINADFYPNTDRKTLLWDELDKRQWNENLLSCVVAFIPTLLIDLRDAGPDSLYAFVNEVRLAESRLSSGNTHPVAHFVRKLWEACRKAFQTQPLFWSRAAEWTTHQNFVLIPYPVSPLLEEAIPVRVGWQLPPPEHSSYNPLFRAVGVDPLNGPNFVAAMESLFAEEPTWLAAEQYWPFLKAVFDYLGHLDANEHDWKERVEDLAERLKPLFLTLNAENTLLPLKDVYFCPPSVLQVAAPWVMDDIRVDSGWWEAAPSVLRDRIDAYTPEDLAYHLQESDAISTLVLGGWPITQAYAFLRSDPTLSGNLLRSLPIYKTTGGEYVTAEDLAVPDHIDDPFQVRKLIDVDSLKGNEALLEKLNLDRLDPPTYYGKLLPDFFRRHQETRREVIEAVAKVYATHSFLIATWKELECAELKDGSWVKPKTAYSPNALMSTLFGDEYAEFAADNYHGVGVKHFMTTMGMRDTVSEKVISDEVARRSRNPVDAEEIALRRKIFDYALSSDRTVLSTHLATQTWLPAHGSSNWHRPEELLTVEDAELVGQRLATRRVVAFRLPERSARRSDNLRAMKFARPEPTQVIEHVGDLNAEGRGPSVNILRWLNRNADRITPPLRERLRTMKLFPVGQDRFAAVTHLFREDPQLGRWRFRVGDLEKEKYESLLTTLDILDKPTVRTYRDVLLEIAASLPDGSTPSKEDLNVLETCIKELSEAFSKEGEGLGELLDSLKGQRIVPVLGKQGGSPTLSRPANALFPDKPKDELRKFNLPEHIDVQVRRVGSPGFWDRLEVPTVSSVWRVTYSIPQGTLRPLIGQSQRLRRMLPSLLRLALKVHRRASVNELQADYLRFQFYECVAIPTRVELVGFKISGECELEYAVDHRAGCLYVRDLTQRYTTRVLAEMMGISDPTDIMAIDNVWSKSPEAAAEYLTEFLVPELPEEYVPVVVSSGTTALVNEGTSDEDEPEEPLDLQAENGSFDSEVSEDEASTPGTMGRRKPKDDDSANSATSPRNLQESDDAPSPAFPRGPGRTSSLEASDEEHLPGPYPSSARKRLGGGHSSPSIPSRQQRFRNFVYVYEGPEEDEAQNHARDVDQRGMRYVIEYETRNGRHPHDESSDYGAGFDILSADADGVVRYIELKTMSGPWLERGVALSANQYALARVKKESFWLYVIENLDSEPALYMFQNPFERVTSYTFDQDWKSSPTTEGETVIEI